MVSSASRGRAAAAACAAGLTVAGAVVVTGAVVSGDAAGQSSSATTGSASLGSVRRDRPSAAVAEQAQSLLASRAARFDELSRSATRPALRPQRRSPKALPPAASGQQVSGSRSESVPPGSPREIAMSLLPSYGWDSAQFSCLDAVWTRESDWNPSAANYSSGAYGIPQALPGSKMAASGSDWRTNPVTQIKWGLGYIRASYGSPCGAWYFWQSHDWY